MGFKLCYTRLFLSDFVAPIQAKGYLINKNEQLKCFKYKSVVKSNISYKIIHMFFYTAVDISSPGLVYLMANIVMAISFKHLISYPSRTILT